MKCKNDNVHSSVIFGHKTIGLFILSYLEVEVDDTEMITLKPLWILKEFQGLFCNVLISGGSEHKTTVTSLNVKFTIIPCKMYLSFSLSL